MKIALFGITGRIGRRIVEEALRRGHSVTAIARDPSRSPITNAKLTVVKGDVTDAAGIAASVGGHDIVVSAVGPDFSKGVGTLLPDAARALMEGLKKARTKRLLIVGGAGSLEVAPGVLLMDTPQFPAEWKELARSAAEALALCRAETSLEWTYLSPAGLIEPGTRKGTYRTGGDKLLTDGAGNSYISMEDFAIAVVDEVEKPRHVRQRFTVAY